MMRMVGTAILLAVSPIVAAEYVDRAEDCTGNNLKSLSTSMTLSDCGAACDDYPGCVGFSRSSDDFCILKSKSCTVQCNNGWTFHEKRLDGYYSRYNDCTGHNMDEDAKKDVTLDKCALICNADKVCAGFSYAGGICIPKYKSCADTVNNGYTYFQKLQATLAVESELNLDQYLTKYEEKKGSMPLAVLATFSAFTVSSLAVAARWRRHAAAAAAAATPVREALITHDC